MAKNETAKATIYLDGKQAEAALDGLKEKSKQLKEAFEAAKKAGDEIAMKKIAADMQKNDAAVKSLKKSTFDYQKVLNNLNGSSLNELKKAFGTLQNQMVKMSRTDPGYEEKRRQLIALRNEIKTVSAGMYEGQGAWGKFMGMAKGFLPAMGVAAVGAAFSGAIRNIIQVRSEFSKYEAVLKNTLGSQTEANKAFSELKEFAAKTPFQLNELTDSYVKLTNQGFQPTMAEMTKIGDLAAAMGKPFDQLTEAIIDAQTGENERLKEFGIKAQKNGDKINYTFKGVTTEVDNNAESIRNYILSLGEMEGVKGGMAEISKTVGGAISNAKDAISNLWNTIGEKLEPAIVRVMNWFSDLMNTISDWIGSSGGLFTNLYNWFADFYNNSLPVRAAIEGIQFAFSTAFTVIKSQFQSIFDVLKTAAKVLKAVFTGNFDEIPGIIKESMDKQRQIVIDNATKIAQNAKKSFSDTLKGNIEIKSTITTTEEEIKKKNSKKPTTPPKPSDKKALTDDQMVKQSMESLDEYYKQRQFEIEKQHVAERDSEASFMLKKAVAERQYLEDKKAMLESFGQSTVEVDRELMKAELDQIKDQEEIINGIQDQILADFEAKLKTEDELEQERLNKSVEANIEYGEMLREQMARTEDEKLALLKEKLDAGKITQKEYEDAVTKIHNDAEEERKRKTEQRFQVAQELTNSAVNLVNSMMELELQKAGDNEEKKNEIRKKYAGIQFASAVAQIVVDTAGSIMKAYQQLGPIAGSVAAALLAATGVVQIQIAKAQRNQVLGYASGGYTGDGDTYEPAGVVHRGEWVAPKSMVRDNRYSGVISFLESQRRAGNFSRVNVPAISGSNARGYATGGPVTSVPNVPGISAQNNEDTNAKLVQAIDKLLSWKPTVHTELIKRDLDTLENINRNRNM